ncbi:hypothetical protein XcuCFBP2542_04865 [Xanthomonas cucurbitae]|uniref:Uncharacterized protein n=1 Tax=Xanthomonas cucurbitae TaxID=56453 RepID=A0A2S7DVG9_9XANT|nr:hypothetical protein XcuCFBP2542_04865 [Xanthomonas cucurbitae]
MPIQAYRHPGNQLEQRRVALDHQDAMQDARQGLQRGGVRRDDASGAPCPSAAAWAAALRAACRTGLSQQRVRNVNGGWHARAGQRISNARARGAG